MTRNEMRELLMQMMYEMDTAKSLDLKAAKRLAGEKFSGENLEHSVRILSGIVKHLDEIDGDINAHSYSWKTNRMPKVDLAIMRLALGEIRYGEDVPQAVAINEAINLAKKYSTEQSYRFIHGVLGGIVNVSKQADKEESTAPSEAIPPGQ